MDQIPAFVLYGLIGCPHCSDAEKFLRTRNIPAILVISNGDPIIQAGIKEVTKQEEFPVLLYRPTREIIVGFKQEQYARLAESYYALVGASTPSLFSGGQQSVEESAK